MRRASLVMASQNPSGARWKIGSLAWTCSVVAILVGASALVIAVRAAITTGQYRTLISHQTLTPFITAGFAVIGALVAARRPRNPLGWIFLAVGLLSALTALAAAILTYGAASSPLQGWAVWFGSWLWIPGVILPMTFVLLLFPDGSLVSPRWRIVAWTAALGLAMTVLAVMLHPGPLKWLGMEEGDSFGIPGAAPILDKILALGSVLLAIGVFGSLAALGVRFFRSADLERQQMKWLAYAVGINLFSLIITSVAWSTWPNFPWKQEINITSTNLGILAIAIAAAIAILRYRLYDIDLIINRTLVYSALTAGVVALYGLVVGAVAVLFETRGNWLVLLLAAGLAAILIQPMRDGLQRLVNRLMYGERDDPYAVLSSLSRQLQASLSPEAALPVVVKTIAQALKLPYVAIALKQDGAFRIAASFGSPKDERIQLPLIFQGETVGQFRLATRSANESFTPGEQRLLQDIARHIGVAAHGVLLTQDLRQLAEDLQRSRQRLVTAREEERRRLQRDLHDGLGPVLAGQGLKLAALKEIGERDRRAASLLDQLIVRNEDVVSEIRRLVYDLRPPALDQRGLVAAVRDQVDVAGEDSGAHSPIKIRVEEPPAGLPPLPAAVEVAAYRIALEALTNVYHHAGARFCTVRFSIDGAPQDRTLILEICDDGSGLPERTKPGVGLISMKERAEEVGGTCIVEPILEGGVRVLARFPLYQ